MKRFIPAMLSKQGLKVLHITEALGGGVASYLIDLMKEQSENLIHPTLFFLERPGGFDVTTLESRSSSKTRFLMVKRTKSNLKSYITFALKVRSHLNSHNYDVIHIHSSIAGFLMRTLLPSSQLSKSIYSPHAWSFSRRDINRWLHFLYWHVEKCLISRTFGVVTVSRAEYEQGRALHEKVQIWQVDNGIPILDVRQKSKSVPDRPVKIVSIGRLCPQKDPSRFNILASSLKSENVIFEWIGGYLAGDESKYTYDMSNTHVTGWISRDLVIEKLLDADVFVLLSAWEGMPIALIEAQTLGLPSVVSTAQGNSEVVKHGSTGFVVSNDVEATEKTRLLISDRKLRRTFKLNAIKARDYWSISRVQSEMRDVYNQVTGSGEDAGEK